MKTKKSILKNTAASIWAIVLYQVVSIALFLIGGVMTSEDFAYEHYFMLDAWMCFILLAIFGLWLKRSYRKDPPPAPDAARVRALYPKLLVLTLGLGGMSILWLNFADSISQYVPFLGHSLSSFEETWSTIGNESYLWVFLSVVLVGPIVEEILFRGVVFHYMEQIRPGWLPILFSGIVFGIWHMEPVQSVYAALLGIGLGMIYAHTHSLKVTILIHVLNNLLSTLPPVLDTDLVQMAIFYLSLLMLIPAIIILVKLRPRAVQPPERVFAEGEL